MNCEDQQVGIPSYSVKWGAPTLGTQKRHSQGVKVPDLLGLFVAKCCSGFTLEPNHGYHGFLREAESFFFNSACDVSWLFRIFQVLHLFPFIPTVRCVPSPVDRTPNLRHASGGNHPSRANPRGTWMATVGEAVVKPGSWWRSFSMIHEDWFCNHRWYTMENNKPWLKMFFQNSLVQLA